MKKLIILTLCFGWLAGCKSSTGPLPPANPAVMPTDGSTLTYAYSGTNPAVQLAEYATIDTTNSEFFASRVSDTVDSFSTTAIDTLLILADGDLKFWSFCGCDTVPLPIATHGSQTGEGASVPVKKDGYVGLGSIFTRSEYLGEETISAAGEAFPCTKVSESDSISMIFAEHDSLSSTTFRIRTYWYSNDLGYFVKEQQETSTNRSPLILDWTRILTAYKLGK
ncbi:MAG: hypothetical protein ACHQNE_10600 [Candidatus Kapaibacterium sp.]